MSVSIEIVPSHDSLEMYGEPDPASAYSLSGHVAITLKPSFSLFDSRKTIRLLLRSLTLTFEGQSELVCPFAGYVPLRLCTLTRQLAPNEPFELTNEGHEGDHQPISWNVVFSLPVPGWLPATSNYGQALDCGTQYALHASAEFVNVDDEHSGSKLAFLSSLCSPFTPKRRTADAHRREICIKRYTIPPPISQSSTSLFPSTAYSIAAQPPLGDSSGRNLPYAQISMVAVTPECIGIDDGCIPFSLRLRAAGDDHIECTGLEITDLKVQVEQREDYRSRPTTSYTSKFPVPSRSKQPPNEPLIAPNSVNAIYELGFVAPRSFDAKAHRIISLHPPTDPGQHLEASDTLVFTENDDGTDSGQWTRVDASIPFAGNGIEQGPKREQWGCAALLRASARTPLLDVSHSMQVSLSCKYDLVDSRVSMSARATERLEFTLPLRFVELSPAVPPPSPSLSASSTSSSDSLSGDEIAHNRPCPSTVPAASSACRYSPVPTLPPYSHLFESDGERKIDWESPLPLYEPPSSSSLSETSLLDTDFRPRELAPPEITTRRRMELAPHRHR